MKATWNGVVIAQSDQTIHVEGNEYFPIDSVKQEYLKPSDLTTVCGWKGQANYFTVTVDGDENKDSAWTYKNPNEAAMKIKDMIAFWNGIKVEKD